MVMRVAMPFAMHVIVSDLANARFGSIVMRMRVTVVMRMAMGMTLAMLMRVAMPVIRVVTVRHR